MSLASLYLFTVLGLARSSVEAAYSSSRSALSYSKQPAYTPVTLKTYTVHQTTRPPSFIYVSARRGKTAPVTRLPQSLNYCISLLRDPTRPVRACPAGSPSFSVIFSRMSHVARCTRQPR